MTGIHDEQSGYSFRASDISRMYNHSSFEGHVKVGVVNRHCSKSKIILKHDYLEYFTKVHYVKYTCNML